MTKVSPRKGSAYGEDLCFLQPLWLCPTLAVCFQLQVTMAMPAPAASPALTALPREKGQLLALGIAARFPSSPRGLAHTSLAAFTKQQRRLQGWKKRGKLSKTAPAESSPCCPLSAPEGTLRLGNQLSSFASGFSQTNISPAAQVSASTAGTGRCSVFLGERASVCPCSSFAVALQSLLGHAGARNKPSRYARCAILLQPRRGQLRYLGVRDDPGGQPFLA